MSEQLPNLEQASCLDSFPGQPSWAVERRAVLISSAHTSVRTRIKWRLQQLLSSVILPKRGPCSTHRAGGRSEKMVLHQSKYTNQEHSAGCSSDPQKGPGK